MASYGRSTRNWTAVEFPDVSGGNILLTVTGEVELSRRNEVPHLRPLLATDSSPERLHLELAILSAGVGDPTRLWKTVQFERKVAAHQYSGVEIASEGRRIGFCEVEHAA